MSFVSRQQRPSAYVDISKVKNTTTTWYRGVVSSTWRMRMVLFNMQDVYNYGYLQNTRQLLHLCRDSKDSQCKLTLENIFHMNTSLCCRFSSSLLFHCHCCWCFRLKSSYLHRWSVDAISGSRSYGCSLCIFGILSLSLSEDEDCSLEDILLTKSYIRPLFLKLLLHENYVMHIFRT